MKKKKILIIGNEGYVGPLVVERFKKFYNHSWVAGFDIGYFTHIITDQVFPERGIDVQYRGDVRKFPVDLLKGFEIIIYLAAISNDPMGKEFERVTFEVNQNAAISIAKSAKNAGIHHFIYASSCSVYGSADDKPRTENSKLNPLTSYAKSKVWTEKGLEPLASENFIITCLRFSTACGFSPRLRLDLVLNDFVASAISTGRIEILSDGKPWRPLINVKDMSRAIDWASGRSTRNGGDFLIVNTGSNEWNYQIRELGMAVQNYHSDIQLFINKDAEPDKRSYKVDFSAFKSLAGDYYPQITVDQTVNDLFSGLEKIEFDDAKFRTSNLIRLHSIKNHIASGRLDNNLYWS
jgi:nucleoside-diphosphate-sugar epimerase